MPQTAPASEVGVDREAAVGAAAVEPGEDLQFGAGETPLRRLAGLVAQRVESTLQPAELLLGQAGAFQGGAQDLADAVEGDLFAQVPVTVDEAFETAGD